jgi:hypothetical protein
MDLKIAKPVGFITQRAFTQAFGVSPAEMRQLKQELARQDVPTHPRHGFELDGAARALSAVRGGL